MPIIMYYRSRWAFKGYRKAVRRCVIEITVLMSCQPKLNRKWSHRCARNQNEANGSRKTIISRLKVLRLADEGARCSGNVQRTWQLLSESICSVSCRLCCSGKNRLISLFLVSLLSIWLPWSLFLLFFFFLEPHLWGRPFSSLSPCWHFLLM